MYEIDLFSFVLVLSHTGVQMNADKLLEELTPCMFLYKTQHHDCLMMSILGEWMSDMIFNLCFAKSQKNVIVTDSCFSKTLTELEYTVHLNVTYIDPPALSLHLPGGAAHYISLNKDVTNLRIRSTQS